MWLTTVPIAHRGLHDNDVPENSLEAFRSAKENGCAIELDLYHTSSNEFIVFHDEDLRRMCGVPGSVYDILFPYAYTLINRKGKITRNFIPTLSEVFTLIRNKVPIVIEVKDENISDDGAIKLIQLILHYGGDVAVHSYSSETLATIRKYDKNLTLGIVCDVFDDTVDVSNVDFVACDVTALTPDIKDNLNMPLIGFTIKGEQQFKKYGHLVDNITFEIDSADSKTDWWK